MRLDRKGVTGSVEVYVTHSTLIDDRHAIARLVLGSRPRFAIYALSDPRTGAIRYVGCTRIVHVADVRERVWGHVSQSRRLRAPSAIWIRELVELGLRPSVTILEIACDPYEAAVAETDWIARLKTSGIPLLNLRRGTVSSRGWRRFERAARVLQDEGGGSAS